MNSAGQDQHNSSNVGGPRVIESAIGRSFTLHLWEDRTRGEQWVPSYNTKGLALVNDEYLRIAGNNAVDNGRRTFEFASMLPGTHEIVFEKRMGWKCTAEDRRVFQIHVTENGKG
ncbi:MAG: protease inhibitor I42 family protein [Nitrospira sp.]|jgi:predicted secreted protein|nr:protease inhibitor I42 family protein [Nitrospira sp.]